jgi:serine/threonine-protein kinase
VVIKRVLPQFADDAEFARLFQQEARFASFLTHPNIAHVSDFGVDEQGSAYLVMEHVEGASLRALLKAATQQGERTDVRLVCRLFSQLAEALAAVHDAVDPTTKEHLKLVHRDVSPENVLLSRQGAVKLADFGIARAMTEISATRPDVVRGKLRYLAPEQILGGGLGPAVDVWALGVSLYETLALRRPFPEESEGQTTHAIAHGEPVPLEQHRPDLPPELYAIVSRCLARDLGVRYDDCHDLAHHLESVASSGTGSVTTRLIGNWVERLCPPESQPALRPLPSTEPSAPRPAEAPLPFDFELTPDGRVLPAPQPSPSRFGSARHEFPQRAAEPPPPAALAPHPSVFEPPAASEAPLELAVPHMAPYEPPAPQTPPPVAASRAGLVARAAALLLVVVALAMGVVWWRQHRSVAVRQVMVTSTPSGATVMQGTRVLGKTPWAGDLPASAVDLEVQAPGFAPQKRRLEPEDGSLVEVTLRRK